MVSKRITKVLVIEATLPDGRTVERRFKSRAGAEAWTQERVAVLSERWTRKTVWRARVGSPEAGYRERIFPTRAAAKAYEDVASSAWL
jgi:hypothetical protein